MVSRNDGLLTECPVCGLGRLRACIGIPQVPVHCNLLWRDREAALNGPRGDIQLGFCRDCGHIFNLAFDPTLVEYTQAYENSLHFSPRFQRYAESLAARLVERYQLYDKDIIEIGSGQGDFLRLLCELGGNRGFGFDPSNVAGPDDSIAQGQLIFIQDYYSERYASYQADLVCSRHVLEHIQKPIDFLEVVRRAIGDRIDTPVYFEVPNVRYTVRDLALWDIIYEHCSYFSRFSLACAFIRCGFRVTGINEAFGGQFLSIEALPGQKQRDCLAGQGEGLDRMAADVAAFSAAYRKKVESWQRDLRKLANADRRVVVWGAGSKGVTFLNTLNTQDRIEYVVDVNPRKEGMYIAGTGQQIVSPAFLSDYRPDVLIVMNPIYEGEIRQTARNLGLDSKVLLA